MNYDQYKLATDRDNNSDLVTSCCGSEEEESNESNCCCRPLYEETDICSACKEHADNYMICSDCGDDEECYEMIEQYEYNERRREDALEFNRDE